MAGEDCKGLGFRLRSLEMGGGGSGSGGGAYAATTRMATTATLPVSGVQRELCFVSGNAGPIVLAGMPRIAAGTTVGQELTLVGTSDTNWLTIPDNGEGVALNGDCVLITNSVLSLVWDGAAWLEVSRNDK